MTAESELNGHEHEPSRRPFSDLRHDLPSSVVVALVALPLCLGIALASDAPLMAGLVTGIVGGLVVAWLSGSSLAVSGPAAGLTVVVADAIHGLGSYEAFLLAVVASGVFQIFFGFARLGVFGYYIPNSVIRGMLAGIGLVLVLKQMPHAVGWDADPEGDLSFLQPDGANTFTEILNALDHINVGACIIALASIAVLVVAPRIELLKRIKLLPPPLLAVLVGIGVNQAFAAGYPELALGPEFLVKIPDVAGLSSLRVAAPDFSRWLDLEVYQAGLTIAAVASVETLLCVEAVDKLDPFKRITPTNRELKAQGVGNVVAGMLGGIPMTAVIVRGSANVQSGGRTPMSAFLHGLWLLLALFLIPGFLNAIPLAALAGILLHVAYKLAPISLFRRTFIEGWGQFLPFVSTVLGIIFTDLLIGVGIGLVVGVAFILLANLSHSYYLHHREDHESETGRLEVRMELSENVSFLNKAAVNRALHEVPEGAFVEIDGSASRHIHHDVIEIINEFRDDVAPSRDIQVKLVAIPEAGGLSSH